MNNKLFCTAVLASAIGYSGVAQAATYTVDFDSTQELGSAVGSVSPDDYFSTISSASMDFTISGKETMTNAKGYSWYYDPRVDISINGSTVESNYDLDGNFVTLHYNLGADAINSLIANQSIDFNVTALVTFWWSDLSPWGGYSQSRFYLDSISLNISASEAPSAVPLPAALPLFGTALVGFAALRRKRSK
ncbi:MAG: VPLPA-CTERM sorting domain-containing protein [Bdellovibrionales bacterium]